MTILFYIICYIVLSIAVAYFFKYRKDRAKEINSYSKAKQVANNIYDRKKHNDYMNNPKFSYMSCNRYNPNSSFHKERVARREKSYVLVEESKYNSLINNSFNDTNSNLIDNDSLRKMSLARAGFSNEYSSLFDPLYNPLCKH